MKYLYKYPQREYPYDLLLRESAARSREALEFELIDTDMFDEERYWDVYVEYAKDEDDPDGVSIRITAFNRGPDPATLHVIPQLWFRNTWSWPKERPTGKKMPSLTALNESQIQVDHETLGRYYLHIADSPLPVGPRKKREPILETEGSIVPELLFTDNDTNFERLYGGENVVPFVKDAFHDHIVPSHRPVTKPSVDVREAATKVRVNGNSHHSSSGESESESEGEFSTPNHSDPPTPQPARVYVNPEKKGTKAGAHFVFEDVPGNGGCLVVRLRLTKNEIDEASQDEEIFDQTVEDRRLDADEFYARFNSYALNDDLRNIMRQALSGMIWCALLPLAL